MNGGPGIIPRNWELVRLDADGNLVTIKKGIMAFDLTDSGDIIYSNGVYLIRLGSDGTEKVIGKVDESGIIKVF
ncbi:MAG TPA: hypothetical protein PLZ08_11190 [Bacillota bacterium]|jgi:hypothetical protein|nr:hypothetical protein [Bacillota bacterium]HOL10685.1 hypothetical protein [Bacillota bacterium]HPO98502.1 hypothetical protein [Bacillota bacterium]